jgi:hypothetical protein
MPASQRAHEDGRLLRLPQELASQVWRSLNCISSCHNLIATSKLTQALMGPAVGSVEFTLKGEDNEPFRGLHPSIQPRIITIKAALAEEQSVSEQEYGSYDQSECHVALCSFVPAFVSSPHFRHLEELALKVCLFVSTCSTAYVRVCHGTLTDLTVATEHGKGRNTLSM